MSKTHVILRGASHDKSGSGRAMNSRRFTLDEVLDLYPPAKIKLPNSYSGVAYEKRHRKEIVYGTHSAKELLSPWPWSIPQKFKPVFVDRRVQLHDNIALYSQQLLSAVHAEQLTLADLANEDYPIEKKLIDVFMRIGYFMGRSSKSNMLTIMAQPVFSWWQQTGRPEADFGEQAFSSGVSHTAVFRALPHQTPVLNHLAGHQRFF